jgi:ABC-type dipeptide/oligopeptide/nickel transport system permease component
MVLTVSTSLVFFMLHSLPGENAEVMAKYIFLGNVELNPSNEEVQLVKEKFDLDRSLLSQYYSWATNAFHGDLGRSYKTNAPVREEILIRLPATITLALIAVLMSLLIGTPGHFGRGQTELDYRLSVQRHRSFGNIHAHFLACPSAHMVSHLL